MKKLWITGVSLSIFLGVQFLGASVPGQESVVANRGKGTCWTTEKDAHGFEIFKFHTTTEKCGWATFTQKLSADGGWNGYVKMVNANDPKQSFYTGSLIQSRSEKVAKDAKVACYICEPDDTNCLPNDSDPEKRAKCWTGTNKINCGRQVNCSRVLDITECYSEGKGVFANQYNDLKLCGETDIGINLSGAGVTAEQGKTEATSQRGKVSGPAAGLPGTAPAA